MGGAGEFQILIPCRHILNFQHDTGTIYDMSGKAARKTQVTIKTFTETGNCTWKASGTQGKVATSYNLKISQLAGVISPLCFKPLVSHPWLIFCAVIFRVKIAASCRHFEHTCWRLFTEEIENVMLWSVNWNRSRCNVVIPYQTIKQPRNVWKTFWKRFKMFRKSRKRFWNLKCAAKVEKENSCSTYAFVQGWNMQVCRDKLLRYCLYVSAHVIKISFTQKLV